jgi:1,2-diacylglycerol 3-alpha-glucosyltransferase
MKIGFFTDTYFPQISGVSTSVEFFLKNLTERGHQIQIIAPKFPKQKKEKYIIRLSSFVVNKAFNYRFAIYTPGVIVKLLKTDFDIIHGHAAGPICLMGLTLARIKKIPYVFTYHTMFMDYSHYVPLHLFSPESIRKMSKIVCNRCDYIIAPSSKVKNELNSQKVKSPIVVIPTGVDIKKFKISKNDFLRKKFNLKVEDKILLQAGRLGKEKSVDFLIHSFKIIHAKNPKAHLIIVGGGSEFDSLVALSKELDLEKNVHFSGLIDPTEIPLCYSSADIFVFSSQTETQGLVVLEAMASGLPIVSVNDEAVMEMIENKVDGILVEKDTTLFAAEVLRLLKNKEERERLGTNARKKAILISKQSIEKLEEVYRCLIKKKE